MNIKNNEVEVDKALPFKNCKLNRQIYATTLTSIIENYNQGFVLAINNKWGYGKTTFVQMWEQHLINQGFQTIYFNAWKNDFEDNPLLALIGELNSHFQHDNNIAPVIQKAITVAKNAVPTLVKAVVSKYIDTEIIVDAIDGISKGTMELFEKDIKEYNDRKESIEEFKTSLSKFVADNTEDKPLIFIIDELDRCRPNYSVLLLEQIKHLFSVPNVVFILSIDKIQLGNAIKGVYGNDKIDSEEYLRRFIDVEYSLPKPDNYTSFLYDYFDFKSFFNDSDRTQKFEIQYSEDEELFKISCRILLSNLTLRQQEKIMSHIRIVLRICPKGYIFYSPLLVFLAYCKMSHQEFYLKLIGKEDIQTVHNDFYSIINPLIKIKEDDMVSLEAFFLQSYYSSLSPRNYAIYNSKSNNQDDYDLLIESKINNELFIKRLKSIDTTRFYNAFYDSIDNLLDKIELTNGVIIN